MRIVAALAALLITLVAASPASAERRIALVVGNQAYYAGLGPLANSVADADLISTTLRKSGFDVEMVPNASQAQLKAAIAGFGERLRRAGAGTTALVYFAGHGLQALEYNYLMAIDTPITRPEDIPGYGTAADMVLQLMREARVDLAILIIDACRIDRVPPSLKEAAASLAKMKVGTGVFPGGAMIAYSAGNGQSASDGAGPNSPFAAALSTEMMKPGVPLEVVFRNVRMAVKAETDKAQEPVEDNRVDREFMFVANSAAPPIPPPPKAKLVPGRVVQIGDFGTAPTNTGHMRHIPARRYLLEGAVPIELRDVTPERSTVSFFGTQNLYEGRATIATVSDNVLTQTDTGNQAASFTLVFPQPMARVRFMIPRLFAATESGITFPAWKATALSASGETLDSKGRELLGSYSDVPEQFVQLVGGDGRGITAVRFDSDPRVNGVPFAAFSAVLIEGIWVEPIAASAD